ncbi:DUF6970 domain-containing protein [Pontibacter silvestris]|uniref:DUF6970 domain-containing protein n=1 Tax=Pontibacter silvestris TaxID=2305183 RepID=A0ABW4X2L3_9BACT|nr:hypothetical protein [Pontibacter silvestris]MCC9135686.1 hypothetical protein [Pontibacter silvestris]
MATVKQSFLIVLLLCLLVACTPGKSIQGSAGENANAKSAPWLSDLIRDLEAEGPANPPAKIYRYTYNDQEVYYLTGRCCDIPGKLYDVKSNTLCEPDGGITGKGDGRCTDFFEKRSEETLIWEDKR